RHKSRQEGREEERIRHRPRSRHRRDSWPLMPEMQPPSWPCKGQPGTAATGNRVPSESAPPKSHRHDHSAKGFRSKSRSLSLSVRRWRVTGVKRAIEPRTLCEQGFAVAWAKVVDRSLRHAGAFLVANSGTDFSIFQRHDSGEGDSLRTGRSRSIIGRWQLQG